MPLGGGAAVANHLIAEWNRTRPFELRLLAPSILGDAAPTARELVLFSELRYARFCRRFERAVTEEILRHDPASTIVLSNDVSEGPDFRRLAGRGFAVYTIYHVDVVAYVAAIYGRGLVSPETLARAFGRLERWKLNGLLPDVARLIFEKQRASVEYSRGLIVPAAGMRDALVRSYPGTPPEKIHVVPWGVWREDAGPEAVHAEARRLRAEFGVPDNALVILTLSRISPEKGQDLLLEALLEWERRGDMPAQPLWVFLCGEAAFMRGRRFDARLRALAGRLRRVRAVFPGYVAGARKLAFFRLADVYVFPSRHESYGLTLLEALAAGLPAISLDHHGARAVMRPECGEIVPMGSKSQIVAGLRGALERMLASEERRPGRGRATSAARQFTGSAAAIAELLLRGRAG